MKFGPPVHEEEHCDDDSSHDSQGDHQNSEQRAMSWTAQFVVETAFWSVEWRGAVDEGNSRNRFGVLGEGLNDHYDSLITVICSIKLIY